MPLFRRHDGDLVPAPPAMRRIMPYLLRTRNESVVFHDSVYRMPAAIAWLKAYNSSHAVRATLFHLFAYACGQALHARPEMNRFVSGGRLYQRRGVQVSFVVKREMSDEGVATTVKVEIPRDETFPAFVARLTRTIEEARGPDRAIDKETVLVLKLPGPLLRPLVAIARLLDAWNLYPRFMTANDPMFASLFLANLGSAGISDAYHHLFEYGTVSIFGSMSQLRKMPFVDDDQVVASDALAIRWSFDERIHDAFYAARSLVIVKRVLEDPTRYLGAAAGEPIFALRPNLEAADAPS